MAEKWMDIKGFGGNYQISSLGRVRSIDHMVYSVLIGKNILRKGRIIKQTFTKCGYPQVTIKHKLVKKTFTVHRLVFDHFWGVKRSLGMEIDHIDNDKTNNSAENLRLISSRENSIKRSLTLKKSSTFSGVSFSTDKNKWQAHIRINGSSKYLGRYENEEDAAIAYRLAKHAIS